MEGGGGEFPMDEGEIPEVEAAPPQQEFEQVLQMEHLAGGGGGELEALDVRPVDVEEQQPRAVVPGGEGDCGSAAVEVVVEEEGERGLAGVAEEGTVSFGVEVEDEDEVVDDEGPPRVAPLASASDAAAGIMEEEEPAVGGLPFVAEDAVEEQEETEDDEPREEELRRGAEGLVVAEKGGVSHEMEAEDEGFTDHENENAQLAALAPLPSDFVEDEENGEADSLVHYAAIEDEVIADDDVAEGDEEEEEEEEAASAIAVEERELTASASGGRNRGGGRKKRGRPPKTQASRLPTKKKEEEDLCFICFDGGNLVVCDRRGCPKVYHPACVNRDESFFRSKGRWNCGWHICSVCEKAAHYMCLTCTYSLCKACIKEAEFVCVRGNKGFCETCRSTVMLIETDQQEKKAGVDFDDRNSWMFLFKDYWLDLKRKLSLTLEEILKAKSLWKGPLAQNEESSDELYDAKEDPGSSSDSSSLRREGTKPARKKARRRLKTTTGDVEPVKLLNNESTSLPEDSEWASEELLEFVLHMRGGDKSVMCQFDVHTLLLEYIKRNNLRDPRRKSQIICDSRLEKLFGKARVGHFEMLKLLESHFLLKETSQAVTDDNQGGVVDPEFSQMDTEGNSEIIPRTSSEKKRKSRKRTEEREPQNNLDDYAAIDIHNISLIYQRRNLMEELLDDMENFSEKVIGSFVRIRISGAGQRQDMYRLVQVIGTGKAGEKYKTGKRVTDITLEILNLDKTEVICIDTISNQEFTEEECNRLRQSIKCGLLNRLTVRDVLEKAMALQAVRVNESLENEKMRLSHLRDRASEKGRRKELRECVEKLQLLNSPEERSRRLTDVPEIHADPHMDPNYESAEEESGDKRQDNFVRSTDSRFRLNPSPKGSMGSTDSWSGSRRGSSSWESSKNLSTRGAWERVDTSGAPIDKVNEVTLNQVKDLHQANSWDPSKSLATAAVTETGIRGNGQDGTRPRQAPSLSSGPVSTSQGAETAVQSNINENEKMWHYQDPSGKIQGPFSMTQLRKWNTTGYFPSDLRIWRASDKQEESILLSDALVGKFHKEPPPPEFQNNTLTHLSKVSPLPVAREGNTTGNWRGNNDSWVEKRKGEVGGSSGVWEPSKDANAWSSQPQVHVPPPSVAPLSANLDQASAHQARDRGGSNGRWKGGPSRGTSWGSHGPTAFHPSGRGYERQHPGYVYPGHQPPGENLKGQAASSSNQWVNDSFNLPTPTPRPGGGWMGSQSIGNQPSGSLNIAVQPAVSGWAGTAVGGGNSLQFPSVAINEASKVSAYVQQPPSAAGTLASWGSSTSSLKHPEMAANWNSSTTAPIAMVKESVLSDSVAGAHAPSQQNGPSAPDRQASLAQSPFNNEMAKPVGLTVTSCNFPKNMHTRDDCPSPTPKDEQAKFDGLISETNQQSDISVDPGKSLSPIRSVGNVQYPASAVASASMQTLNVLSVDQVNQSSNPASSTLNLPSNNEMSSTKPPDTPSDAKYNSPSQDRASDFSQRKETDSLGAKPPREEDGLEQPQTQNLQIFDPAKSGHLVLPAVRTDWSMPSPTPLIEPSVSHDGTDSAPGVNTYSQWNSSMQMQGTGNNEIRHYGVGISQENMNRGVEPGKEGGHINHGVHGTTNAGLGAVMPANACGVWANPPQANTNVNVGWCPPQQGNANMNMFWVALAQANPGWGNQLQANPNPNPGWVLTAPANTPAVSSWGTVAPPANPNPNQVWGPAVQSNANANAATGWAVPQSNANPNAGWFGQGNVNVGSNASAANPGSWGAPPKQNSDGCPAHNDRGFQNNDAGHGGGRHGWNRSQNSGRGGPPRGPPPRAPPPRVQGTGICKYHESGHCRKGAHCNFLHT